MNTILAFAGSNSSTSINHSLVGYTASLVKDYEVRLLDMVNHPFPMYSEDNEKENGFSDLLLSLMDTIRNSKGLVIAVNEHNSYPSAYFKNLMDWLSRVDSKFLADKQIFLMSTSPGGRGAIGALEVADKMLTRFNGTVVEKFSLPKYGQNFNSQRGIINNELAATHQEKLNSFLSSLSGQ